MANIQESHSIDVPSDLEHLIGINVEFKVLVCLGNGCSKAVSGQGIVEHLRKYHKVKPDLRKQVERFIKQHPFEYDYSTIQLPPDGLAPQALIPIFNGMHCKTCSYRTQSRNTMKKHGNKAHQQQRVRDEDLFYQVLLQTWFRDGKERYWVVDKSKQSGQPIQQGQSLASSQEGSSDNSEDDSQGDSQADSQDESQERVDNQIARDMAQKVSNRMQRQRELLATVPVTELDPWLRYTGWNDILTKSKHNMMQTHYFVRMPDLDEPELVRLLLAWDRITTRCKETLRVNDHSDILKLWASPVNSDTAEQKPFELPQNHLKTISTYSGYWKQFLCYIMRTAAPAYDDETETGVEYSLGQWEKIDEMRRILQTNQPEDDTTNESEQDQKLTNTLMAFCMTIVMQDTSSLTRYQSPLMHFLAVMGVNSKLEKLHTSISYTPILAGVLWINRLLVLEIAVPVEKWPMLKERTYYADIRKRIRHIRSEYLCEGSFSPTSAILGQLAKGMFLSKNTDSDPNIHWSPDEKIIYWEGQPVELSKIGPMCNALNTKLQGLAHWLAFDNPLPKVDLSKVIDSLSVSREFMGCGYSFINHKSNRELLDVGHHFMLKRAQAARGERRMIKRGPGRKGRKYWADQRQKQYLGTERQFLRTLMASCHLMGGQPARGPELGSVKVGNSIYSIRNLVILNGRVCFVTTYTKTRTKRGTSDFILRYMPDQLSQIIIQYLVYIRPFARALDDRESEYLFADPQASWAGVELTRELRQVTKLYLGTELTVASWRHVSIGIGIKKLGSAIKMWDLNTTEGEEDSFAEGYDQADLQEVAINHTKVRQSAHGRVVARGRYAIDAAFLQRLGPEQITLFEIASVAWHILFDLPSRGSLGVKLQLQHKRDASQQVVPIFPARRVKVEVVDRATAGLQMIYPGGKPQSEGQAAALELVHQPPDTCLIILPTSSGKSLLFFSVAAMVEEQAVLVVVPFTALVDNLLSRGREVGLRCEQWTGLHSCAQLPQLIIVSADQAVTGAFLHYIQGVNLAKQLAHVFFDEVHVAITDTSYRKRLRDLYKLRALKTCPFTGLTATLMLVLESTIQVALEIPGCLIFRRATARPSIRYSVCESGDQPASVYGLQVVQDLVMAEGQRGIVYVRSKGTGNVIKEALGCEFYEADADSKSELLYNWSEQGSGWIVATGALGTGINISDVTYIVHIERPYGLTSFVQQSGRGGRGGEVSNSIMIIRHKATTQAQHRKGILSAYTVEAVDEDALTEYIQSSSCRRVTLAKYFDPQSEDLADCVSTDSILCDYCVSDVAWKIALKKEEMQIKSEPEDEIYNGATARLGRVAQASESLLRVLQYLKGQCIYCEMMDAQNKAGRVLHSYARCATARARRCSLDDFYKWQKRLDLGQHFKQFEHCHQCGLSQQVCYRLEDGNLRPCEYANLMLPAIFIYQRENILESVVREIGFQGHFGEDIWEWLGRSAEEAGGPWQSNWSKTWQEMCRQYWIDKWDG